jgi:hypothetical protein
VSETQKAQSLVHPSYHQSEPASYPRAGPYEPSCPKSGHPCASGAHAACSESKDQNSLDQAARTAEAEEELEEEASARLHQLQEQLLHHHQLLPHHLERSKRPGEESKLIFEGPKRSVCYLTVPLKYGLSFDESHNVWSIC